jgi:hypothetical protein
MTFPRVIAGLDPAIHPAKPKRIFGLMDARVRPAHDGVPGACGAPPMREIAR